jgi:hypothetical protein
MNEQQQVQATDIAQNARASRRIARPSLAQPANSNLLELEVCAVNATVV